MCTQNVADLFDNSPMFAVYFISHSDLASSHAGYFYYDVKCVFAITSTMLITRISRKSLILEYVVNWETVLIGSATANGHTQRPRSNSRDAKTNPSRFVGAFVTFLVLSRCGYVIMTRLSVVVLVFPSH